MVARCGCSPPSRTGGRPGLSGFMGRAAQRSKVWPPASVARDEAGTAPGLSMEHWRRGTASIRRDERHLDETVAALLEWLDPIQARGNRCKRG
ncbi:MAG: hypothetical protein VXZ39_04585 [Planctomycetota bacterium]|nr:hypothetical protein [Planctomycetota bacterium]MEC8494174.1 hypothetical protein [Planctomycetota bacterium]